MAQPEIPDFESDFVCNPHSAAYQDRLYKIYRRLRDDYPVYYNADHELWIVSRYDDVMSILLDAETFSSTGVEEAKLLPPMMIYMDGTRHTKLRNLFSRGFTPRVVAAMEERVGEITDGLLDRVSGQGPCELMGQFAAQLPSLVMGEMIGVPEEHRGEFLDWTEDMIETGPNAHPMAEPAAKIFAEFKNLLDLRRGERRDDLMSALLDAEVDGERLSEEELLGFCFLLLVAGNDTTMNLIGNGIALLAQHPEQRAELVGDPSMIPEAIEEMLRFESPTQALPRRPTRDFELHGVTIPANCRLLTNYGSANRDDRFFQDPERFDIHRENNRHLALGQGSHFCMGASLARLEARIAFETLLARYPEYELSEEPGWVTSRWARSHPELRIDLEPRA